jgi:hypothetical protein
MVQLARESLFEFLGGGGCWVGVVGYCYGVTGGEKKPAEWRVLSHCIVGRLLFERVCNIGVLVQYF